MPDTSCHQRKCSIKQGLQISKSAKTPRTSFIFPKNILLNYLSFRLVMSRNQLQFQLQLIAIYSSGPPPQQQAIYHSGPHPPPPNNIAYSYQQPYLHSFIHSLPAQQPQQMYYTHTPAPCSSSWILVSSAASGKKQSTTTSLPLPPPAGFNSSTHPSTTASAINIR